MWLVVERLVIEHSQRYPLMEPYNRVSHDWTPHDDFRLRLQVRSLKVKGNTSPQACVRGGVGTVNERKPVSTATLHTNRGDIVIELFDDQAPKTVENFVGLAGGTKEYVDAKTGETTTGKFYDGLTFHRVIDGFMIQGGCPRGDGRGDPGYRFDDEFHPELSFDRPYLLAMANAGPGTNGSQFFITVAPTPHLNRRHTIFGEVTDEASQKVVDAIATTPTGMMDRPVDPVVIESVELA